MKIFLILISGFVAAGVADGVIKEIARAFWARSLGLESFFTRLKENKLIRRFGLLTGRTRRLQNLKIMPDFLGLLALSLSAGNNFIRAWEGAVENLPSSALKKEAAVLFRSVRLGQPLAEALDVMSRHLAEERFAGLFALMRQSLKRGVALHDYLSEEADRLRLEYFTSVEKRAQTLPIRLLFPILLFIFPTIFLVLFGSIYLQFMEQGFLF